MLVIAALLMILGLTGCGGIKANLKQENFDQLDENIWVVSDGSLGRSHLNRANVSVNEGLLRIKLPKNSLDGGEIYTAELQELGTFEARMKLPDAPTSITGFFLYKAPDYYYEIDIEVVNGQNGPLLLTTYADGQKNNEYVNQMNFDPTKEFHDYRIEVNQERVSFYIDAILIESWSQGFPKEKMYLMLNCWYPQWLAGEKTNEDQSLLVDWIRY
ncbi:MAG: glycoside hydrolase family 16 protein [Acetobacterium sp.]